MIWYTTITVIALNVTVSYTYMYVYINDLELCTYVYIMYIMEEQLFFYSPEAPVLYS